METVTESEYQAAESSGRCRGTCRLQRNCRPISGWRQEIQAEHYNRTFKALRRSRGETLREIKTFNAVYSIKRMNYYVVYLKLI